MATKTKKTIKAQLAEKQASRPAQPPHLIIEARAGTGKTTTLVEGLKVMRGIETAFTPSEQQRAIWDCLALSRDAKTVGFVAFNKSIATELQRRVPAGCEAMTMHSMGFRAVNKLGRFRVDEYRVSELIARELGRDLRDLRKEKPAVIGAVGRLVSLCKMNLAEPTEDALDQLVRHYDVEVNHSRQEIFDLVPKILARCADPAADGAIDFDDMVWLPVRIDLPVAQYDVLLVDEAQDLNRCQQALAKKAGRRLILCGDPRQAIYGFAGADAESMKRMATELSLENCAAPVPLVTLPLTVTRRCGKAIVEEAKKIVPDFGAFETNPEGVVRRASYPTQPNGSGTTELPVERTYLAEIRGGDMAVCRVNAPLVRQCFKLIRMGVKATIQGRDVAKGLTSLVTKMKADSIPDLVAKLSDWLAKELAKEGAARNPSESRMQALEDRHDCVLCFTEGASDVPEVLRKIEAIFTDDKNAPGVRFSSIHKAKGLEAHRVFFLKPAIQPPFGGNRPKPQWVIEQEANLEYVAITRAIEELIFVI